MWKRVITFRALGWVELGGKGKFAGVVIFMVAPDVKGGTRAILVMHACWVSTESQVFLG